MFVFVCIQADGNWFLANILLNTLYATAALCQMWELVSDRCSSQLVVSVSVT